MDWSEGDISKQNRWLLRKETYPKDMKSDAVKETRVVGWVRE